MACGRPASPRDPVPRRRHRQKVAWFPASGMAARTRSGSALGSIRESDEQRRTLAQERLRDLGSNPADPAAGFRTSHSHGERPGDGVRPLTPDQMAEIDGSRPLALGCVDPGPEPRLAGREVAELLLPGAGFSTRARALGRLAAPLVGFAAPFTGRAAPSSAGRRHSSAGRRHSSASRRP